MFNKKSEFELIIEKYKDKKFDKSTKSKIELEIKELLIFSLINEDLFFGNIIMQLPIDVVDDSNIAYITYERKRIVIKLCLRRMVYYTVKEMIAILKHELMHFMFNHMGSYNRFKSIYNDPDVINIACDAAINYHIENLPKDCVTYSWINSKLQTTMFKHNESAEDYLVKLSKFKDKMHLLTGHITEPSKTERKKREEKEQQEEKDKNSNTPESSLTEAVKNIEDKKSSLADLISRIEKGDFKPEEKIEEADKKVINHNPWLNSNESGTLLEEDAEGNEAIKDLIEEIIENAKNAGAHCPKYIDVALKDLRKVYTIPWQTVLKRCLGSIKKDKRKTILKRNRRQPYNMMLKGQTKNKAMDIIFCVDTSGSVSNKELEYALGEIYGISSLTCSNITVYHADTRVRRKEVLTNEKDIHRLANVSGRGGTEFSTPIEEINKDRLKRADVFIYFTDGGGEDKLRTFPNAKKSFFLLTSNYLSVNNIDNRIGILHLDKNKLK